MPGWGCDSGSPPLTGAWVREACVPHPRPPGGPLPRVSIAVEMDPFPACPWNSGTTRLELVAPPTTGVCCPLLLARQKPNSRSKSVSGGRMCGEDLSLPTSYMVGATCPLLA